MFKVKNFDYDLWATDDGKRFARVRRTGEVCEVDEACIEQIRILKNELDSFDGYMLQFNESVFNKITDYITVLNQTKCYSI